MIQSEVGRRLNFRTYVESCGASWLGGSVCDLQVKGHGFDASWAEFAVDTMLLGKAFTHTCTVSRPRSKSGYLVGPRRLVCVIRCMCV